MKKVKIAISLIMSSLMSLPTYAFWGSSNSDLEELKFSMVQGIQSNEYKAAKIMSDYVNDNTDGKLTIRLYSDAQLGDDLETMEQMTAGALDLGYVNYGRYNVFMPELTLLQYPYVFKDFAHIQRFSETAYFQEKKQEILNKYKWRQLSLAYGGARNTTTTVKEINSVEDFKSLKIRTPKAKGNMAYVSELGASPTPMAFSEVYLALKTNAVDGQENPLSIIDSAKFYEVQKNLTLTKHITIGMNIVVSDISWNRIPEDYRDIVKKGAELAAQYVTDAYIRDEKNLITKFENAGMKVSKPDLSEFAEAFVPLKTSYKDKGEEYQKVVDAVNESS
ncbi:DctP family TRAP transporter solute-binding subunit [Vibrio aquaticus]|uniref:DctP family TRAP transporter solute-binding subunit n=1 Tax=Vibrio aquaticus TaxID=2496559 RepID=A0A3S0PR31_9VIBR|nr:DctP family TRAP transporter solute-binding subunit [Vibrio aquaticus]RTZ18027.1 DctP family TRAP transporter solute-binding subunit [Vibrio aquaticus]